MFRVFCSPPRPLPLHLGSGLQMHLSTLGACLCIRKARLLQLQVSLVLTQSLMVFLFTLTAVETIPRKKKSLARNTFIRVDKFVTETTILGRATAIQKRGSCDGLQVFPAEF